MSSGLAGIALEVSPEEAREACREAVASLHWELTETAERRLLAREDPARLSCRDWPAEIEVEIDPAPENTTAITLACSVPGIGPLSSRHLHSSLASLEGAIRRRLAGE